jgi:hypothetical protein
MPFARHLAHAYPHTDSPAPCRKLPLLSFSSMSDAQLLRFGVAAKFRCSQLSGAADPGFEALLSDLKDARAEWNRRHPDLPLCNSF